MTYDGFAITSHRTGTTARIAVSGELDIDTTPRLRGHADRELADHAEVIVIDLSNVSFIDSSGLHALLDAVNRDGGRMRIVPSPACLRLFDITGVRDVLPLIESGTSRP